MQIKQKSLANEVVLDVLKFMNYGEHCKLEGTVRIFRFLIDRYRNELALCKFYQLQILPEHIVSLTTYRRANEITEYFIEENCLEDSSDLEEGEGWEKLIEDRVPLFAFPDFSLVSQNVNEVESYLLFITKEDEVPQQQLQQKLCLELPLYPESREDVVLIRLWFKQLARAHFQWVDCGRAFFNPDWINALWPSQKNGHRAHQRIFHCRFVELKLGIPDELQNSRFVQFALENLLTDCLTLRCRNYFEGILDLLLKAGSRIRKVVFPVGPGHSTVELQNLIIYHAERALNPLSMVDAIEFLNVNDLPWPDMRSAKCIVAEAANGLNYTKYSMNNSHLPNVQFEISIGHLLESSEIKRFYIRRVVG